jgi:putative membrane protein
VISHRQNPWIGALAGAMGGIAGVFAMTALQLLFDQLRGPQVPRQVRELSLRGGRHDIARLKVRARRWHLPQKDATVRAAERVSYLMRGMGIRPRRRHIAGIAVHYGFGAIAGGVYGYTAEKYPAIASASGLPFGAGVWLLAEELALPATGLSEMPEKYPLGDHFNALASHLVYGLTTDTVRRRALADRFDDRVKDKTTHNGERSMSKQETPHTQTQQNTTPEQSDFEADQKGSEAKAKEEGVTNTHDTGSNRNQKNLQTGKSARKTEPESSAHEGAISTRTPKRPVQGITAHSAQEESDRQEMVVKDRPDAQAGVNRSK